MAGCLGWTSEVTGLLGLSDLPRQNRTSKFFIIEYADRAKVAVAY